jgi:hypothetical protein
MANTKYYIKKPHEVYAIASYWIIYGIPVLCGIVVFGLAALSGELYGSERLGIPLGIAFVVFTLLYAVVEPARAPAGDVGEDRLFRVLKRLGRRFTLLNNIHLPNQQSRNGETEVDAVLVSKKAVYVIEGKHKVGTIYMDGDRKPWGVSLSGEGEPTERMRNPVRQVKTQSRVLGEHLGGQGISLPVYPIVVFTADRVELRGRDRVDIPVIDQASELLRVIRQIDKALPSATERSERAIGYIQTIRND